MPQTSQKNVTYTNRTTAWVRKDEVLPISALQHVAFP